ncbi:MAG: SRPBCC family protein [Proteobacteria bacterium]|nr:SRPBCC family protein [Pseudomonadota bacterium]
MPNVYASTIVDAPVEAVWKVVRDFNGLPTWLPGVAKSEIEDGRDADCVGCVRRITVDNGATCSERLLALDDSRYIVSYAFVENLFPISGHRATKELIPVTAGDRTFVQWSAHFLDQPGHEGETAPVMQAQVFEAGLASLVQKCAGAAGPEGAVRWDGWRPAKVFCSSVINGPVEKVWDRVRDFIGMGAWHPDIRDMKMIGGVRSDKISGVRDFMFGDGRIMERLTYLNDADHEFRYLIEQSPMPWLNYHAGARFLPITAGNKTFAVWTADWMASPNDDVKLIVDIHQNVFQKAFDTLNERFFPA